MRLSRLVLPACGCLLLVLAGSRAAPEEQILDVDSRTLQQGGVGTDGPALLEFFRQRTPSADHRVRIPALIKQLDSNKFTDRQQASEKLENYGVAALPFLRAAGKKKSLEMTRRIEACLDAIDRRSIAGLPGAAARLLRQRPTDGACAVLLDYLPYANDRAVEEEVLATLLTIGLSDGKADAALVAALKAPVPERRAAAALVVLRSAEPDQRKAARLLLTDGDARVRLRAAQGLLLERDREAVPVLIALLTESPTVALQAEEVLLRIAGAQAPIVALRPGEDANKCRQAWHDWWRDAGAKLDLPRMDDFRCQLGYTLVAEFGDGVNDRVVELGADGRPRWRIENLQYPVDAVVLGDNRVLIVEHNAKRVCERDFKGNILWEKRVSSGRVNV